MANPTFKDGAIPRFKRPGVALLPEDSVRAVEAYGIHKTTAPTLADGDVCQEQMDDNGNALVALGDPAQVADLQKDSLGVPPHDYIALTYVAAGNGAGKISTAVYKIGGSSGTTVATITLTYDSSNRMATVTRT